MIVLPPGMRQFKHIQLLFKRIGIAMLAFTLARLVFFIFNKGTFTEAGIIDFIYGWRFDINAISWIYMPFILLSIIPLKIRDRVAYQKILAVLFHISNITCIVFNMVDVEFFPFTFRRSTADVFSIIATEGSFFSVLIDYLLDFWYILLIGLALIAGSFWLYRKTSFQFGITDKDTNGKYIVKHSLALILMMALWVVGLRGGVQLVPINLVNAGNMTTSNNIPLVLNTPFTIMKTLQNRGVEEVHYLPEEIAQKAWTFNHKPDTARWEKPNIVIIILESFSKEYIGFYNKYDGYTPVLDSLLKSSLSFDRFFANGKRSIDGIPAVVASLPPLMNDPYITSPYASNQLSSLPSRLNQMGYKTSFYHGGANGTMGFESFTSIAGYDEYIGMNEYPNKDRDYDGNWGIFDEQFYQFFANRLTETEAPFMATFFSLSSHHPYVIPDSIADRFPEGPHPILKSVAYADYALGKFFETARKQPWFKNTLFAITADHASYLTTPIYNNSVGQFSIPMLFYMPADSTMHGRVEEASHQLDITPTILSWIGYPKPYFSFGEVIGKTNEGLAITYTSNRYQIIHENYVLKFDGQQVNGLYDYDKDFFQQNDLQDVEKKRTEWMLLKLKAFIQENNYRLIHNQLSDS